MHAELGETLVAKTSCPDFVPECRMAPAMIDIPVVLVLGATEIIAETVA